MTILKVGQSLGGPLPRWATPTYSRLFNEFMPLICYAFYLYAQSIKASHHHAFQVKALKIYAPIPKSTILKSNIQYNRAREPSTRDSCVVA